MNIFNKIVKQMMNLFGIHNEPVSQKTNDTDSTRSGVVDGSTVSIYLFNDDLPENTYDYIDTQLPFIEVYDCNMDSDGSVEILLVERITESNLKMIDFEHKYLVIAHHATEKVVPISTCRIDTLNKMNFKVAQDDLVVDRVYILHGYMIS